MCYIFLTMTRSHRCTCTKRSFGKASKFYSSRGLSGISKSARWISKSVYIFLTRKYTLFGHPAYFRNHYGSLSHLRAKYGKSPQKMLRGNTNFRWMFWFGPNISWWKLQDDTFLLICALYWYIAVLACLWRHVYGVPPPFWMQKNYASAT